MELLRREAYSQERKKERILWGSWTDFRATKWTDICCRKRRNWWKNRRWKMRKYGDLKKFLTGSSWEGHVVTEVKLKLWNDLREPPRQLNLGQSTFLNAKKWPSSVRSWPVATFREDTLKKLEISELTKETEESLWANRRGQSTLYIAKMKANSPKRARYILSNTRSCKKPSYDDVLTCAPCSQEEVYTCGTASN